MFSSSSWSVHLQKCTKRTLSECCMWRKTTENNQTHHHIQTTSLIVNVQNSIQLRSGVFILHTLVTWCLLNYFYHTQWTAQGAVFLARSVALLAACMQFIFGKTSLVSCCFLFAIVYKISREPLNGYVPNSQGKRVWFLAQTSLKVKVKGQGHQGEKTHFLALSTACMRFISGKTSVASSFPISASSVDIKTKPNTQLVFKET